MSGIRKRNRMDYNEQARAMFGEWKAEIESDVEYFRRTFNDPDPPKAYHYGDGSGDTGLVSKSTNEQRSMIVNRLPAKDVE